MALEPYYKEKGDQLDALYELGFINENLQPKQLRIVAEYLFGELILLEVTSATNAALKVQELKQRYPKAFISKKKVKPEVGEK